MRTILQEGMVVQSDKFINGIISSGRLRVGDYPDNYYQRVYKKVGRKNKQYVITEVKESFPHITCGNRTSSYENTIIAQELNPDGTYNENGEVIEFSTCLCYSGFIGEGEISIVKRMKKTYV